MRPLRGKLHAIRKPLDVGGHHKIINIHLAALHPVAADERGEALPAVGRMRRVNGENFKMVGALFHGVLFLMTCSMVSPSL